MTMLKLFSTAGGRALTPGKMEILPGGEWGYFIGYNENNEKFYMKQEDINQVLRGMYYSVQVKIEVSDSAGRADF